MEVIQSTGQGQNSHYNVYRYLSNASFSFFFAGVYPVIHNFLMNARLGSSLKYLKGRISSGLEGASEIR